MNAKPDPSTAVFVSAAIALKPEGGGVQRCTREYLEVIQASGLTLHTVAYPFEHRPWVRLRRKLHRRPYDTLPQGLAATVRREVAAHRAGWILFNQTEAAPLALELADLRQQGVKFALLSHGTDSCDYLHLARTRAGAMGGASISARDARWLGGLLLAEQNFHRCMDVTFCLSETDRELERWLGCERVVILPRLVHDRTLPWQPQAGRVGTVGTLTHGPNYEGLVLLCRELERDGPQVRVRLVGTPEDLGRRLAAEFSCIDYLGGLNEAQLHVEAASWCAFVNPIFCYPRGCSTKTAVPLEWRMPVATTRAGARGYHWDDSLVPLAETPGELAQLVRKLADPAEAARLRAGVVSLAAQSPQTAHLANLVRANLR